MKNLSEFFNNEIESQIDEAKINFPCYSVWGIWSEGLKSRALYTDNYPMNEPLDYTKRDMTEDIELAKKTAIDLSNKDKIRTFLVLQNDSAVKSFPVCIVYQGKEIEIE